MCDIGKSEKRVEDAERARILTERTLPLSDLGNEPREKLGFQLAQALFGTQQTALLLLELDRDEALGAAQRLLAHVVRRNEPRFDLVTSMA